MSLLLGVDGGGSKTTALLADAGGRVLGRGVAGPSNYQAIGLDAAGAAIEQAARAAYAEAGIAQRPPSAICLGLAGAGRPDDAATIRAWAAQRWPGAALAVVADAELPLAAGTPDGWGLALICGTGSVVYGRDAGGRTARAGGWGYLFGDEGSGYAIGVAALRAVAHAADGRGPATALTDAVLRHWALATPQALIARVYRAPCSNAEIAELALLVDSAAAAGDDAANAILRDAARELAGALVAVAARLDLAGPLPCALAGGLIVHCAALARQTIAGAEAAGLALAPVTPVAEPALGALAIAGRMAAWAEQA